MVHEMQVSEYLYVMRRNGAHGFKGLIFQSIERGFSRLRFFIAIYYSKSIKSQSVQNNHHHMAPAAGLSFVAIMLNVCYEKDSICSFVYHRFNGRHPGAK